MVCWGQIRVDKPKLGQIMTLLKFSFGKLFMCFGPDMASYGLLVDEWFWAMFEPTPTWPNFDFVQLFMWIEANNDQIRLSYICQMSDSEEMFEPTPTWPNFDFCQLCMCIGANKMARYDFLEARCVILSLNWLLVFFWYIPYFYYQILKLPILKF